MGIFDDYINLETPPVPPFAELPDDYANLRETLRNLYLSHESITHVAHDLWLKAGSPDGEEISPEHRCKVKDLHWWQAQLMLESVFDVDFLMIWSAREAWKELNP